MEYTETNPVTGCHRYVCVEGGCHLKGSNKGGIVHCDSEVWEDPPKQPRVEFPLCQASGHRADIQEPEGVAPPRAALRPGTPADQASHPDEHLGVTGDGAGQCTGRQNGRNAVDGEEGGVNVRL